MIWILIPATIAVALTGLSIALLTIDMAYHHEEEEDS